MKLKQTFIPGMTLIVIFLLSSCSKKEMQTPSKTTITFENVTVQKDFAQSGEFRGDGSETVKLPVILPGQKKAFSFYAGKGQALMFATMYGESKDWFFAPQNPGIMLYGTDGNAITGDVSSQIKLWDNGSKNNTSGDATSENIAQVPNIDASKLMKLTLSYDNATSKFTLEIENRSGGTANETPFSPGVWVISNIFGGKLLNDKPFFTEGQKTNDEMKAISETGNNAPLLSKVQAKTAVITAISPVIVVVYTGETNPVYEVNVKDAGIGLADLAQRGDASKLKEMLTKNANVKRVYILGSAPIIPGGKESAVIEVGSNEYIAYATMFGYSNDWFFANSLNISLSNTGDITSRTGLFDNGTRFDQFPGAGNGQGLFGGTPSAVTSDPIRPVDNIFPVPEVKDLIKVTLQ